MTFSLVFSSDLRTNRPAGPLAVQCMSKMKYESNCVCYKTDFAIQAAGGRPAQFAVDAMIIIAKRLLEIEFDIGRGMVVITSC